jgi:hypothetical protein
MCAVTWANSGVAQIQVSNSKARRSMARQSATPTGVEGDYSGMCKHPVHLVIPSGKPIILLRKPLQNPHCQAGLGFTFSTRQGAIRLR